MSRLSRFLPALLLIVIPALVHADPPGRVGRLALVENSVNFHVDRDDPGSLASINWPISSGALLETGGRGRSEVWVGSTAFRLAPNSQLEFPVIDDRQVRVRLAGGSMAVSIFDSEQSADITVETPEGRISFVTPGRYRIDVLSDHTELTAQAGQAMLGDDRRSSPVAAGQKLSLYGDGQMRREPDFDHDAFDNWVAERENAALATVSRRYVSPAMTGYQDLDAYGDWNSTAEYGAVWYPRSVADDWAPYRFGRWAWVAPWGWTWVDQSPWGFAPFHYGRWVHVHNRWGWVPGSYVARPVYAPALVAWIGNPGWSVGFRSGAAPAVGWFPLAPREVYVPGFRASSQFVHRINGGHVRNVVDIDHVIRSGPRHAYAYRDQPRAVTIVPAAHLSEGRPIRAGEIARHDRRDLERAPQARPAPDNAVLPPPAGGRQFRDERREAPWRGREADAGSPRPAVNGQRPEAETPMPRRDEGQRGNFSREPGLAVPAGRPEDARPGQAERRFPGSREVQPARSPETPRPELERRGAVTPGPAMPAAEAPRRAPEVVVPPAATPAGRTPDASPGQGERRFPGAREGLPARSPETPRPELERRGVVTPGPAMPAAEAPRRAPEVVVPPAAIPAGRTPDALPGQGERHFPGAREGLPARSPEMARPAPERRASELAPAMPAAGERGGPGWRPGNEGRDERQTSPFRENPPVQPAVRDVPRQEMPRQEMPRQEMPRQEMPRQEREMPRQFEMPRQREAAPVAPPQPMRAPVMQPAPAAAPVREMPRFEPRAQPQAQPQMPPPAPQQRGGGQERRHDQRDERGGR